MKSEKLVVAIVTIHLLIISSTSPLVAMVQYNVIDLGTLGGQNSSARSANNNGQIVGDAEKTGQTPNYATLFDTTGGGSSIALSNSYSRAWAINDAGQIVGQNSVSGGYHATLFDNTGNRNNIDLGTLPGDGPLSGDGKYSAAWSINNSGQIVGWADSSEMRATLFDNTGQGQNINLGTLGGNESFAYSLNDYMQIVGYAENLAGHTLATLFDPTGNGNNISLGSLPGYTDSKAHSINNNGQIVGWSYNYSGDRAIIFDPSGGGNNIDLGVGKAYSINNSGQIVGSKNVGGGGNYHAFLFDPTGNGNNIDLNTLIDPTANITLRSANCITDNGWIVGVSLSHAYLLAPVPEPCTLLLFGLGTLALRKRK